MTGPAFVDIRVSPAVAAVMTGFAIVLTAGIVGVSAMKAVRTAPGGAMRRSARGVAGKRGVFRGALIVAQVATALIVLVGAGLLTRSFQALRATEVGFATENLILIPIPLPRDRYPENEQVLAHTELMNRRLAALPGVVWAENLGSGTPGYSGLTMDVMRIDGAESVGDTDSQMTRTRFHRVSAGWIESLGLDLLQGRHISEEDGIEAPRVVVVSESLAEAMWPGGNPLGRSLRARMPPARSQPEPSTVIGVVSDARNSGRIMKSELQLTVHHDTHFPWAQELNHFPQYLLRTSVEPTSILESVRTAVADVDAGLAIGLVRTIEGQMAREERLPRFLAFLMSLFGALALGLAAIGLYAVLAYGVARRTRELGLRTALGASARQTVRMVLAQAGRLTTVGLLVGLVGAWAMSGLVRGLLYEVAPLDPVSLLGAPAALVTVALLAALRPALRAARVDPMEALRAD